MRIESVLPFERRIAGERIGWIGLGGAAFTFDKTKDEAQATRAIHLALEQGIRVIDTAAAYARVGTPHHNEGLIGRALARTSLGTDAYIVTKGGHFRSSETNFPIDGSRERLTAHVHGSLRALGRETIDLYLLHWPDPEVEIEESIAVLEEFRRDGLVRNIGLSNASVDLLQRAQSVAPIAAVENHLSPFDDTDREGVAWALANAAVYLVYSPLGGTSAPGLASGRPAFADIAARHKASPQAVALRWLLSLGKHVLPISGATSEANIRSSALASTLDLSKSELAYLDKHVRLLAKRDPT
jgi:pyridoxine 4-dehydrogenase